MRLSKLLAPTLREVPSDAKIASHQWLLRAGYLRQVAAGIYDYLPLMTRVIHKVSRIVREEMDRAGAQELLMPFVQPAELWRQSGRYEVYGKELARLKDRHDNEMVLGPTHEEVITSIAAASLRSYRQLSVNLYQIQAKFRDEIRPRFGLLRGREFIMKDAYSFHPDTEELEKEYLNMCDTYTRIFKRCGLETRMVESDTGAIGGTAAHEFMVIVHTEAGENDVLYCDKCDYAANRERAESVMAPCPAANGGEMARVETPGTRTIEELAAFLKIQPAQIAKTLLYKADDRFAAVVIRGDLPLNEIKLKNYLGANELRMATDEEIAQATGSRAGFIGPLGLKEKAQLVADLSVQEMTGFAIADNTPGMHVVNASWQQLGAAPGGQELPLADLRESQKGERCPRCREGSLDLHKGIEVGNTFKLGTKYSDAMGATFADAEGQNRPFVMGCYGIGVTRTAQAAVERYHDANGIAWPAPIAPYHVLIVPVNSADQALADAADDLYRRLQGAGVEVAIDDRPERAGVKFKDADLMGFPLRVTVGKALAQGEVEFKERATGASRNVKLDEVVAAVQEFLRAAGVAL